MTIFLGLHKSTASPRQPYEDIHRATQAYYPPQPYEDIRRATQSYYPPQPYEDICRTTQAYCNAITYKTLQHHHLNYMRIFVGLHNPNVLILQDWRMTPDAVISTSLI